MTEEVKKDQSTGRSLAEFFNQSNGYFYAAKDGLVSFYYTNADGKRCAIRKVRNFDEEAMKHTSKWVDFGVVKEKKEDIDPALVDAIRNELDRA